MYLEAKISSGGKNCLGWILHAFGALKMLIHFHKDDPDYPYIVQFSKDLGLSLYLAFLFDNKLRKAEDFHFSFFFNWNKQIQAAAGCRISG